MRSALVSQQTYIVDNVIIADPSVDPSPVGYDMIALPSDSPVSIGWVYDPSTGEFTNPNPVDPDSTDEPSL